MKWVENGEGGAAFWCSDDKPNGRRLNLGRRGGTAEASLTLTGGTVFLVP